MTQENYAVKELDALSERLRARLAANPDYIALKAVEKARAEIVGTPERVINDATGEVLHIVQTGTFAARGRRPSQIEATALALEQAREPLPTPLLVERARALGASIGGKNPNINIGSTLSRSEEFKSVKWKGAPAWWFKNRPLPSGMLLKAAE